jgi:hypothetical protein
MGRADLDRLAVQKDFSGVGAVKAVEDLHEGTLTGSVFPQKSVDFSPVNFQTDPIVGQNIRKFFGYALQEYERRSIHLE